MTYRVPQTKNDDELYQLSKEQLVEIIKALQNEMARLKESLNLDSKTSSKPPSQDFLKKTEKKKRKPDADASETNNWLRVFSLRGNLSESSYLPSFQRLPLKWLKSL